MLIFHKEWLKRGIFHKKVEILNKLFNYFQNSGIKQGYFIDIIMEGSGRPHPHIELRTQIQEEKLLWKKFTTQNI